MAIRYDPYADIDPELTLPEVLTPDELMLIGVPPFGQGGKGVAGFATAEEDFRLNAWDMYGPEWEKHVPQRINAAFRYFFGTILWPNTQLQIWHSPVKDIHIHGARAASKTYGMALIGAMYGALYPGNDVLQLSLSKDQVNLAREVVQGAGGGRINVLDPPHGVRNFMRLFSVRDIGSPQAQIDLRRWDTDDPGTKIMYRSVGTIVGARIRSIRAGQILFDEAFREYDDDWHIRVVAGCRMGANGWKLAQHPDIKAEYEDLAESLAVALTPEEQKAIRTKIDTLLEDNHLGRDGNLVAYGNVGPEQFMWDRYEWGRENPGKRYSVTWVSTDNPATTSQQVSELRQQFGDDEEAGDMEVLAKRPPARSDVFTLAHKKGLFDLEYSAQAQALAEDGAMGYSYDKYPKEGLFRFAVPPEPGAIYAGSGDPGNDWAPGRNSWCVFVIRVDPQPFKLVYFEWGNFRGIEGHIRGSIKPWLRCVYNVVQTYPMLQDHFAAEASSTQRNVHEIAWDSQPFWQDLIPDEDRVPTRHQLVIKPITMTVNKPILRNKLTLMLTHGGGLWQFPQIEGVSRQMDNYKVKEDKPGSRLAQDLIQGMFALADVVWEYAVDVIHPITTSPETVQEVQTVHSSRDIRSYQRDYGRLAR